MAFKQPKVFLDSNVLLSGLVSDTGAARRILDLAEVGFIQLVLSNLVIVEVDHNLQEHGFDDLLPLLRQYLLHLKPLTQPDPAKKEVLKAAKITSLKDAPILAAAIEAQADYLLTFNERHFRTPAVLKQVSFAIMTPAEFLASLNFFDQEQD